MDDLVDDAIRSVALDYIEGWYSGDADRMRRAVHPSLAKRVQRANTDGSVELQHMDADALVRATGERRGRQETSGRAAITVLDRFERAATVRIDATAWIDYLHLANTEEGWKVINVLWEPRPD